MESFVIEGGTPLSGELRIQGAKNAALPILAATVLTGGSYTIYDVPRLSDIDVMLKILTELGAVCSHEETTVHVDTTALASSTVPEDLMGQMRSSIFLMGPLLARFGEVILTRPGGCAIGERRIDLHLKGLEALGARIIAQDGFIRCTADKLKGGMVFLDYPSVGATENIMMAAVLAQGETVLSNAAREPEIIDLQNFLNRLGARVHGAGTDRIVIEGVSHLQATDYQVIPDRIVTGTMMLAAAITQGKIVLRNVNPMHLIAILDVVKQCGVEIDYGRDIITVKASGPFRAVDRIITAPYPGFPTDMQSQTMAFLSVAKGCSIIKETVFDGRFRHVNELCRLGADIYVDLHTAFIRGVPHLSGTAVEATDLRAGAALIIGGLAAEGETKVTQAYHIDRGYDRIEEQLASLGARIRRV
ncbi:UDP-N-acetylglucosamine 1-carboxyvinyltransferase [Aneurinibacillus migulanus]|uniref:UDP-N-acetylglucosamine 1-carboxyvinyltransferase n=1 Tax=Aneurinibacillus migulanus TaxID=47500 RepID=UPI00209DBF08|nr:UDP-N-acetylglucosamine 1-carboxyvinyltransferase [Aneurinibacillus migulanus]MCP1355703.1 UDP-N-acetylglucosamine 1-carboxyvinyltransferase [Aneurinibacillus migulanus]